jgi:hypothetical protein
MKTPRELSEELLTLSGEYSNKTDELNELLDLKADNWESLRKLVKSDASCDKKWEALPEGKRERRLRLLLKSYEKRMSAIKTSIQVMEGEARSIW